MEPRGGVDQAEWHDRSGLVATTDTKGAISLRRAGRMHHLRVGAAHAGRRVLAIVGEQEVTVVALDTGEILSAHRIEPARGYWRNTRRDPGRWPGSPMIG